MQEFKVIPHQSIGPIHLGMLRDNVRQIFGSPNSVEQAHVKWGIHWPDRDFFFRNAFQVTYNSELEVTHIEVASEPDYVVTFAGINVHAANPREVIAALEKLAPVDNEFREYPVNLWFPDLDLNLFRSQTNDGNFETIGISIPAS